MNQRMNIAPKPEPQDCSDILCIGIESHGETWVYLFVEDEIPNVMRVNGRWASNPDLSFTWYVAAIVTKHLHEGTYSTLEG